MSQNSTRNAGSRSSCAGTLRHDSERRPIEWTRFQNVVSEIGLSSLRRFAFSSRTSNHEGC